MATLIATGTVSTALAGDINDSSSTETITETVVDNQCVDEETTTNDSYESNLPYIMLAKENLNIYSNFLNIYGDLKSNKTVTIYSNIKNINGEVLDNANDFELSNIGNLINRNENIEKKDFVNYYNDVTITVPISFLQGNIYCKAVDICADIQSTNDIMICCDELTSSECQYVSSENGNITINVTNCNLNGILYAPNGSVTINANAINFTGIIIAKDITINSNTVYLYENEKSYELYDKFCNDIDEQNELIEEYENIKTQINYYEAESSNLDNTEILSQLHEKYNQLHNELEKKDMFMSSEEIDDFLFDSQQMTSNSLIRKASYPMQSAALDKKFDVVRSKSTTKYNGKTYQYYSVSISDKNTTNKFYYRHPNLIIMKGKVENRNAANKFLNSTLAITLPKAIKSLTFTHPFAGKAAGALVKAILKTNNPTDLIITSKNTYEIPFASVETPHKYTFVLEGNTWYNVYNCNRAIWTIKHSINTYKNKKLTSVDKIETLQCNGDYFKSYKAVQYFVENKNAHGGKYVNNSLMAYKTYFISDMIIKDSSGKKHTIKSRRYPTTTSILSIV